MRFAVYYAPAPESLLNRLGSVWLGRDAFSGERLAQPFGGALQEITAEARRYGFHATLKPPFALKGDASADDLVDAAGHLAMRLGPVAIRLALKQIDGFLALVPANEPQALNAIAASCVRELDRFRRPAGETELAKRRAVGLTARQDDHLVRWGYPYVFEDFRFHLTLTRRLVKPEVQDVLSLAQSYFADILAAPQTIDNLSIFVEPAQGADFAALRQFSLLGLSTEASA
jgi:putative phosphonate metabolism protein